MPGYFESAMHEYQHKSKTRPQHEPYKWEIPDYGPKTQWEANKKNNTILPTESIKYIQKVAVKFLYYARSVDTTMMVALGKLAMEQSRGK